MMSIEEALSLKERSEGMAARVDVASGEVGQAGDAGIKPELGPKPCLIPKPFSLQRNTTFRSILAPKTLTMTPQPSQTTPTTSSKPEPCQPISAPVSDSSSIVKLDAESTTIPELTNALKVPSAITPQTESTHITEQNQTALSTSLTIPKSEPPAITTSDPTGTSEVNQVSLSELDEHGPSDTGHSATGTEPVPSVTSTPLQTQSENTVSEPTPAVVRRHAGKDQAAHLGGGRKRLSMELTSRFESAGLSLPSQPPANQEREQVTMRETAVPKVSVLGAKEEEKVTDSPGSPSEPECRLKHSTPLKEERDGEGVKEEGEKKGNSIQRRISLLLDSSSRLEALTNREEVPRPMKQAVSSGGVKQRIKDWAADTPPVQASNQRVDVAPQPFPVRVHPVLSVTGGSLATSKSVQLAPREDKASTLLHAGHSGIEDEEEEEEEDEEEEEEEGEKEEDVVPLYKTVGIQEDGQEDGGKKQELVVDQIWKEMEAKVKEEEKLAEVDKLKQLELEERQAEDERERERQKVVERERERQREEEERKREEEEERKRQREMEREMKRQRQREEERDRERQRDKEERERKRKEEKERERQIELEKERERQKEEERDRERQRDEEERERNRKEEERERLIEFEKERERQREEERDRERQRDEEERKRKRKEEERERLIEFEKERERQRDEEERERKRKEDERERLIEFEKERERQREEDERERKRKEEKERERQIELEKERERQREEEERKRKRKEEERERLIELEKERERQREEDERERKRKEEKERERQIELEKEREQQREEEERKRKEEKERERQIELEKERKQQREEEERKRKRKEEKERERLIEFEKERERQREEEERKRKEEKGERQREVERENERQVEEGEREKLRMKEERLREKEREKLKEKEREMEIQRAEERMQEDEIKREEDRKKEEAVSPIQFITLKPDQPPKPEPPPSTTVPIIEPIPKEEKQPHIEVVYDDFSVKEEKPLIKMVYDDFSVKPRRWGSQARFLADRAQVKSPSPGTEEPESLGSSESDLQRTVVDTREPAQESPVSVKPHPAERDLEGGVPTPKDGTENKKEKKKKEEEKYKEEGTIMDMEEVQLTCYVGAGEGRDTESLIGGEPDKQYGGCDTRLSEDDCRQTTEDQISPVITPVEPNSTSPLEETEDQISPVITPDEPDSTSPLEETEDPLPFPYISAPLLDTSVLRARAELRKSRRTRPTRAFRQSSTTIMLEEDPDHDWRFYDSSDKLDSLIRGDCASGEEQPRGREVCSQPSQPQRIALFSGMDPSALKAQLKKRGGGGGGGGGAGEGVDTDRQTDRLSPSPSQLSRSPRRSSFLPGMSRVLPPVGNKGAGGDKSPSWLRELKSKKRSSQYNSEA
ncbi:trichohyalin-like [Oncorhynchus clarkii lewisi]|uniref:trichohyalin-like n=1 Tax=Oncorhynchus clarkii lewisi TaxID=490388 RepID=UPI0039B93196